MSQLKEENSYRNILKRLSAFGGVQIFNILIGLIRGKFVALFLGPTGMGISSLYASSTAPLQQICSLGLNLAVVKEVAANKENTTKLHNILRLTMRILIVTGLLGVLVCGVAAPFWSKLTFGNYHHTVSYLWLSLFVGLSIGGSGLLAVLQGLGEVKRLALASLIGGVTGLVVGVPLYYFFGDSGIVPAMIALALSTFLFYYISYRRGTSILNPSPSHYFSREEQRQWIKKVLLLGFILLAGSLAGQIVGYLINLFIRAFGSIEDVGLFQGANSVTNQYIGMIISALALDYFPRLSSCSSDKAKMRDVVNRQVEIVMLVATPLLILLILTSPLIIKILLTKSFESIIPLMRWMGFGMLVQILGFPFGYIYVACDDRKAYIWLECVWTNICWLICSVAFYYLYGLTGLGISLLVRNAIDLIINLIVIRRRYGYLLSKRSLSIVMMSLLFATLAFGFSYIHNATISYVLMTGVLLLSSGVSIITLRKKTIGEIK